MGEYTDSSERSSDDAFISEASLSHSMNASVSQNDFGTSVDYSEKRKLIRRRTDAISIYKTSKMTVWNKICYGMGGAPYEVTNTVIGFYISLFLLETAKIPPIYVSVIVFFGRVWDGLTDPIVAYLVSKTNTKYGVLKPWMLFGAPLATVAYFLVWYVPETDSIGAKVAWYLLFYCAFQTFLTCYQMPFGTYMLFVTDQQDERDSAENFRMGIELFATIIGTELMGLALLYSDTNMEEGSGCSTNVTNVTVSPNAAAFQIKEYMIGAICICGIFLICAIAVLIGTTEREFSNPFKVPRDEPFVAAIKRVLMFKPWLLHVGTFISFVMALQFMQANFVLFNKYDVGMKHYENAVIIVLVAACILLPVWDYCRTHFGKKNTLTGGMLQSIPLIIAWGVLPYGSVWVEYLLSILLGSCLSVVHVAAWAMVPDVIDFFMVETRCSYETIFFTFYLMFIKFAAGITLGFSNFMLGVVTDYDICDGPESVLVLRMLVTLFPAFGIVFGYIFLWFYPITEEVKNRNITILEIWRKEESGESNRKSQELHESLSTKTFL